MRIGEISCGFLSVLLLLHYHRVGLVDWSGEGEVLSGEREKFTQNLPEN